MTTTPRGVEWLNALPAADAVQELLTCCGSTGWARAVQAAGPFADAAALGAAADTASAGLSWPDVEEALARHPRIGERAACPGTESAWSRGEQAGTVGAAEQVMRDLYQGNIEYEKRFGHVFLICATGLSAAQMLAALTGRLDADPAAERETVRAELLKITHLRLKKLLEQPTP